LNLNNQITGQEKGLCIHGIGEFSAMSENLQMETGQLSREAVEAAGKSFAKKTQFPIGNFD
jgi:hypothetical protein